MVLLIKILHVVTCVLFLIPAILIQSGKGAEISASFGGSSQTVFGTTGGANFLVKLTYGAGMVFMCTSLLLTYLGTYEKKSIFDTGGSSAPSASSSPVNAASNPSSVPQATTDGQSNGNVPAPTPSKIPSAKK